MKRRAAAQRGGEEGEGRGQGGTNAGGRTNTNIVAPGS